jgi:hypothetical protein
MKRFVVLSAFGGAFAFLAAAAPVLAAPILSETSTEKALAASIGQPVYDLRDMQIGVIRAVTNEYGEPSVIVTAFEGGPGNHEVIISDESFEPRDAGGWLAALSSNTIRAPRPYRAGLPPA